MYNVRWRSRFSFFLMDIQFIDTYFLLFTVPFMDKNFLFLLDYFDPLPKIKWPPEWASPALWIPLLCESSCHYHTAWFSQLSRIFKSGNVNPPTLLFLFKIAPNIWSVLHFHINSRISLSIWRTPAHCILTFDVQQSIPTVPED